MREGGDLLIHDFSPTICFGTVSCVSMPRKLIEESLLKALGNWFDCNPFAGALL